MSKTDKEKTQKNYAFWWFIALVIILGGSIFLLLAIQYNWFHWVPDKVREPKAYDPVDPLTWVLASLIGAALYLMGQIATYYPKIKEKIDPDYQNDFVGSTYWYASTLLRAPVLTVVIMWLLTNLSVNMGGSDSEGLSLDFSKFPDIVNLGIAFILGFYGRVARKQLDVIAKYLFTKAWALAELGFDISTPEEILLGETYTFKTEPKMDVVWSANPGSIGADSGVYTAPSKFEGGAEQAVVLAYLRSEPSATYVKQVPLKLFRITADKTEADPEASVTLKLEKKLDKFEDKEIKLAEAVWTCDDTSIITDSNNKGESISIKTGKEDKTLVFTAAYTLDDKKYESKFNLKVVKP